MSKIRIIPVFSSPRPFEIECDTSQEAAEVVLAILKKTKVTVEVEWHLEYIESKPPAAPKPPPSQEEKAAYAVSLPDPDQQ